MAAYLDRPLGNVHVSAGYCPLAELAAIYYREIDGRVLTLSASGWTYRSTFVLFDYETESLWYDFGDYHLTCIAGHAWIMPPSP